MEHAVGASDTLAGWLAEGYASAFRTACLILHNPADAEEAVQDAFLRAWRFRDAMPSGEGAKPWLYRVVVNACLSKLRRRRDTLTDEGLAAVAGSEDRSPEVIAVHDDDSRAVLGALRQLPEHLRVVIVLRYYAGLTEAEIATAIRRRPGTVKSRLHEARRRLAADPALGAVAAGEDER